MKILHIVPGLADATNGIAVAAKWIAEEQCAHGDNAEVIDTRQFIASNYSLQTFTEVWIHSMWLPQTLMACWRVLKERKKRERQLDDTHSLKYIRMQHGCLDPVKMRYHWIKKIWVVLFDWWLMRQCDRVVATEDIEVQWIQRFLTLSGRLAYNKRLTIQMLNLGSSVVFQPRVGLGERKFLFVGRLHPLKGVDVLLDVVCELQQKQLLPSDFQLDIIGKDEKGMRRQLEERVQGLPVNFLGQVSEVEKQRIMRNADCLVLPTLSENFALVVKESLKCGVPVITTDGAMIWKNHDGVTYLEGYVAALYTERVAMLRDAMLGKMQNSF